MTDKEILTKLMAMFYIDPNGAIVWGYKEGVSIDEIDGELANALAEYLPEWERREFDAAKISRT